MRFAPSREHLEFFYKHHFVEFENLLTETEIIDVKHGTFDVLAKRLKKSQDDLKETQFSSLFMAGYDLWRENHAIKKIVLRPKLAEIAAKLTKARLLRIGFDQTFYHPIFLKNENLPTIFQKNLSLRQLSCFQGVMCGLMLNLSSLPETYDPSFPVPQKKGSGIFFSPDIPLPFQSLLEIENLHLLLIVYCKDKTIYTLNQNDPHTHAIKKLSYGFGDKLTSATHPIIFHGG